MPGIEQLRARDAGKPAPKFVKGQRVKQGGVTFEWDGQRMVPVE